MKDLLIISFLLIIVDAHLLTKDWRTIVIAGIIGAVAVAVNWIEAYRDSFERESK